MLLQEILDVEVHRLCRKASPHDATQTIFFERSNAKTERISIDPRVLITTNTRCVIARHQTTVPGHPKQTKEMPAGAIGVLDHVVAAIRNAVRLHPG